jgi:polysaccharide chain length determinant protein (PEP-CTERM system associated)
MADIIAQILTHALAAWRRRGIAIVIAWLVALVGWSVVAMLPDNYRSSAVVHVDTASVLEPLLRGLTVELDLQSEIELMQRTLLSRPNVEKVLRDTDLDLSANSVAETETLLQSLSKRIKVSRQGTDLFEISFDDRNPQLAHDVVQSLLTIFVENNLGQNRGDMDAARRFIEDQIKVYETKLAEAERRIAEFRQKNLGLLPGQNTSLRSYEETKTRVGQLEGELREARLRRATLNNELKNIPRFLGGRSGFGSGPPTNTAVQILQAQQVLDDLLSRYTDKHPDVVVAKRRLDTLLEQQKAELDAAASTAAALSSDGSLPGDDSGPSNPIYEQLKVQLIDQDAQIAALQDRLANAKAEVDNSRKLAELGPELEVELARLNRDYNVLMSSYNQLLSSRETEQISRARDTQAESIRFRVMEPPTVPSVPVGPFREIFLALVLLVGLGSGVGFAILLALSSETFATAAELKAALGVPVLGTVSTATQSGGGILTQGKAMVFWTMTFMLFAAFAALWLLEIRVGLNEFVTAEVLSRLPSALLRHLPAI